MPTVCFNCCKT